MSQLRAAIFGNLSVATHDAVNIGRALARARNAAVAAPSDDERVSIQHLDLLIAHMDADQALARELRDALAAKGER